MDNLKRFEINNPDEQFFVIRLTEVGKPVVYGRDEVELFTEEKAMEKAIHLASAFKDHYVVCKIVSEHAHKPSEFFSNVFHGCVRNGY